jgi:hypothetical protein
MKLFEFFLKRRPKWTIFLIYIILLLLVFIENHQSFRFEPEKLSDKKLDKSKNNFKTTSTRSHGSHHHQHSNQKLRPTSTPQSVTPQVNSSLPKRRTNKEALVIENAKALKHHFQKLKLSNRKPFLIATFINATRSDSRNNLYENIRLLGNHADFAVVAYDGDSVAMGQLCYPEGENETIVTHIIHCKRSVISYLPDHRMIPKPLLYPDLLHYLPDYERTMLMDEDMSLIKFNYTEFMTLWDCSFWPLEPPLIVQSLIVQRTQAHRFVHWGNWKQYPNRSEVIASSSGFIEQQVPAFDSLFLLWFIENVMSYTYTTAVKFESDWGADGFWCAAARPFAIHVYKVPYQLKYIPCALLTGTSPFMHLNSRTLPKIRMKYLSSGQTLTRLWVHLFPTWFISEKLDPLNETANFLRSYGISKRCPLRHGAIR